MRNTVEQRTCSRHLASWQGTAAFLCALFLSFSIAMGPAAATPGGDRASAATWSPGMAPPLPYHARVLTPGETASSVLAMNAGTDQGFEAGRLPTCTPGSMGLARQWAPILIAGISREGESATSAEAPNDLVPGPGSSVPGAIPTPSRLPTPKRAPADPAAGADGEASPVLDPPPPVTLRKSTWYRSSAGAIWVQGEVVNSLPRPVGRVRILATFHSGTRPVATASGYAALNTLPASSVVIYDLFLADADDTIDRVTVAIDDYLDPAPEPGATGLRLQGVKTVTDGNGWRDVKGGVRNDSSSNYSNIWIHVGFYDAAGDVVRTALGSVKPGTLAPGEAGVFEALGDTPGSGATTCRMWVDAR